MRTKVSLAAVTLLSLSSACVADLITDPITGLAATSSESQSVIVGGLNWQDVTELPANAPERIVSRAVGYLSLPTEGARCTAFLIAEDVVMTNRHCVPNAGAAAGATVSFQRETGVASSDQATYDCSMFLGNDATLDFALLQCSGQPGLTQGVVTLDAATPHTGDALYVIHQNCDYYAQSWCDPTKKISRGEVISVSSEVSHNADTLGGSSGSPVFFAASNTVFALHHVGVGGGNNGRGSYNKAVPMSRIVPVLQNRFPEIQLEGAAPSASDPPSPASLSPDALEPNDDVNMATMITAGVQFEQLTITQGDRDLYVFTLAEAAQVNLALQFVHAQGDIDVTLHPGSPSASAIAQANSGDDNETLAIDLQAGTYYFVVFAYAGGGGSNTYGLSLDVNASPTAPAPPAGTDPFISDNGTTQGTEIALPYLSPSMHLISGDQNDYIFSTQGGHIICQINFSHAQGDLDLYLYKSAGQQVAESVSVDDNERIAVDLSAGSYDVRVVGYSAASADYVLDCQ